MATEKKYLDLTGLRAYDELIKAVIADGDEPLQSSIDNIVNGNTAVGKATHATSADSVAWSGITGKPSIASASHTHAIDDVTNLQSTIDTINEEIDGSIKSLSVSGKTITYTKNDGTTGTITTQDTNTDTNVSVAIDDNGTTALPLLLATGSSAYTGTAKMDSAVKLTPSTNTISANISGNAATATSATSATKATQDGNGKNIASTYETKSDATAKLTEAKSYTDEKVAALVNGAPETLDTLDELAAALDDNADIVDALNQAIGLKADQTALDTHTSNTTVHITADERTKWNAAKTHADSAHAPSNAEKNQNAFSNVKVGTTTIAANTTTDTLELVGSNVTITPDTTNDKITIAVASGSTSTAGILKLTNSTSSTSTTTAATPNSVKSAYDLASQAKTAAVTAQSTADGKANASHTHTVANITDLTATATELNYMDGVTSNVQTQLDGKAASGHTHDAATTSASGFMTAAMVTKLGGIAEGAQVNQNAFSNVKVGSTTIAADTTTDTLTIAAGTGISVTGDATNDKVTITNSGVRSVTTGTTNGTISVNTNGTTTNVAVYGLGSAAYEDIQAITSDEIVALFTA